MKYFTIIFSLVEKSANYILLKLSIPKIKHLNKFISPENKHFLTSIIGYLVRIKII
jgi:hypothetical protein